MENFIVTLSAYSGLIASIWIVAGVYIAGKFYPNYNHKTQFCSELGASGSPTEKLSPMINNYPLGLLFCLSGWYIWQLPNASVVVQLIGVLVMMHGVCTWIAGYFPMDADPYIEQPTRSCNIHSWAGFIMLMSLLIAPLLAIFYSGSIYYAMSFRVFSAMCVVTMVFFMLKAAKAYKQKTNPGLHQRLSYGAQLIWLSVFSIVIVQP